MSDVAISIEGVGKQYVIGSRESYQSLRENVTRTVKGIFRREKRQPENKFWALRDVSLKIPPGQIVGLIGRNGAGKSTLLKILSRITAPTEGRIALSGRVGSLLEVGVGFHPELTGRENIFLNGAILGMRRAEIQAKFDEIVAFSEVERFLETPVKRYSSGMYVRLAFSVAAHLEPEILLVDEVLAVGDAAFQKKCMGKMGSVARQGRTIIFVSHNMVAMSALCERGVLFESGRLVTDTTATEAVDRYLLDVNTMADRSLAQRVDRNGSQLLKFTGFEMRNARGEAVPSVVSGQDVTLAFTYEGAEGARLSNVRVAVGIHGRFDESLFHLSNGTSADDFKLLPSRGVLTCRIPRMPLQPGNYSFNLFCTIGEDVADWIQNAGTVSVEGGDFFGTGRMPGLEGGPFLVGHSWSATDDTRPLQQQTIGLASAVRGHEA
jgi:lipopolysaccharide transport system ATP-binding protein